MLNALRQLDSVQNKLFSTIEQRLATERKKYADLLVRIDKAKKNKFQGFSLQLVRKFAHSLLQCLDTLYRNKIIHCDMKPENVLLKQQGRSGIKVSLLFLSRSQPSETNRANGPQA